MRKAEGDSSHPPRIEEEDHHLPSKGWAEMIRKLYELDPLLCPQCAAEMKVEELKNKIITGEFVDQEREEFTDALRKINKKILKNTSAN